ncbi:FtsK/SpoIIIE domain-containing protein [Pseudofrankia saprophytica]|uniref:FtsK/SpoIIIE domain-containing protein n=1 Tax=Pseudofrankia saprophytica TaxID=298655 RepID=UPI000234B9DB|nr:FtsK/SpoIIIE domain-containing protein [Pseudofrankia saprophytica]
MSETAAGGPVRDLAGRWDQVRTDAHRVIQRTEQAIEKADTALATRRGELDKARGRALTGNADWRAREVDHLVGRAREALGSRWSLWEEAERDETGPSSEVSAAAALAELTLAVRRLRSPLRRKRHWVAVAVAAVRRCDDLIARSGADAARKWQEGMQAATRGRNEAVQDALNAWRRDLAQLRRTVDALRAELDAAMPPADADWSAWHPLSQPVDALRIGTYSRRGCEDEPLTVPALFPFPGTTNLVVRAGRGVPGRADAVLGVVGRMLASIPAGRLRLSVIDPIALGSAVRSLAGLNSDDVRLMDDPLVRPQEIENKLTELVERIGRVDRDLLGPHRLGSLVEFNRRPGARPEPYHVVVVFDFPRGFTTPESRTRLDQVMLNGPRCGVYTILVIAQDSADYPHHLAMGEDGQVTTGPAVLTPAAVGEWTFELEHPAASSWEASEVLRTVVDRVADAARDADRVVVTPKRMFDLLPVATRPELGGIAGVERLVRLRDPSTWWQADATESLAVPLGTYGLDDLMVMRLGDGTRNHVMIAGMTGAGKSTLLHTLITVAAVLYSPAELELYLIDMKQGVEFQEYARRALPHARVVAMHSQREFGLETMRTLTMEIERRAALFKRYQAADLAGYRRARAEAAGTRTGTGTGTGTGADADADADDPMLARVLLVVDEFHVLFDADDETGREAAGHLATLVRMGRAYGVHVLLASQTPSSPVSMGSDAVRNMEIRIALRCHDQVSRRILAENNPAATELAPRGEAIYNASSGQRGRDTKFQVAYLETADRAALLDTFRALARSRDFPRDPLVYDGDRPGDITSGVFAELAGARREPAAPLRIWLGEPLGLSAPVHTDFAARADRALLAIGDDPANVGVLTAVCASLAAGGVGRGPGRLAAVSVVDFTAVDQRYTAVHEELVTLLPGLRRCGAADALAHVGELAELVEKRTMNDSYTVDLVEDCRFLLLNGLHRCRGISAAPSWSGGAAGLGVPLDYLLREGPEVGVFVVATIDGNGLRRVHRDILNQFGIVLTRQRPQQYDRVDALSGLATNRLRDGQALLNDDGDVIGLRPFQIPPPGWLAAFARGLPPLPRGPEPSS